MEAEVLMEDNDSTGDRHYGHSSYVRPNRVFFSILGDIFTKKRNKLYPAMTKMVAVVKDKVRRISPGDDESGVDSDNEMIEDEAELSGQLQREMNDSSDENSEEGESGSTRIS
ncbi:hypothetical protein JCM33374_g4012 [Metschnikowia sp. JCM 33374]|nr:hypothetical protein JCM33374_g4012 [Metschnikowia sp. JCM 33374]